MLTEPKGEDSDLMPVLENLLSSRRKSGLLSKKVSVKAESNIAYVYIFIYKYEKVREKLK